uniref:Uncharacterized protein n=1 Tax=Arundo donax TaxID=35708 RepID=A0A0A9H721_ARUDO
MFLYPEVGNLMTNLYPKQGKEREDKFNLDYYTGRHIKPDQLAEQHNIRRQEPRLEA